MIHVGSRRGRARDQEEWKDAASIGHLSTAPRELGIQAEMDTCERRSARPRKVERNQEIDSPSAALLHGPQSDWVPPSNCVEVVYYDSVTIITCPATLYLYCSAAVASTMMTSEPFQECERAERNRSREFTHKEVSIAALHRARAADLHVVDHVGSKAEGVPSYHECSASSPLLSSARTSQATFHPRLYGELESRLGHSRSYVCLKFRRMRVKDSTSLH